MSLNPSSCGPTRSSGHQFRAEAYNALNHANFSNPNTTPTSSAFGTVTSQNGNPRWWQLALKVTL